MMELGPPGMEEETLGSRVWDFRFRSPGLFPEFRQEGQGQERWRKPSSVLFRWGRGEETGGSQSSSQRTILGGWFTHEGEQTRES